MTDPHRRRGTPTTPTVGTRSLAKALQVINNMWAASTWASRISIWNRWSSFQAEAGLRSPVGLQMAAFVESTSVSVQSRLTYAKALSAIASRMELHVPQLAMYCTGLRAMGALIPIHQATPATRDQVWSLTQELSGQNPQLALGLFLAWKTASRWDDIFNLTKDRLILVTNSEIIIAWGQATKGSRLMPYRTSAWTVIHDFTSMEWAVKLIESLPPLSRIVTTTTDQLDRYLHANTNPRLTAHSFKRGALSTLLEHVVSGDLDIRFISLMGKHKTDHEELPASTIRYLTGSATECQLARALGTQTATILL